MIHHPGFCKVCGEPTHKIERQYPLDHPLVGRPMRGGLGEPLADVVKASLLLTNGTWADLIVHRGCVDKIDLPQLWGDILETFRFEEDNRVLIGAMPLKPRQKEQQERMLLEMASVAPLGVVYVEAIE